MPKSAKLVIVSGLLVLVAVVGFLLSQAGNAPPPPGATLPGTVTASDSGDRLTSEAPATTAPTQQREAVATPADTGVDPTDAALDPEIRAALAGFTGRVLHHGGEAAAQTRVQLYRFDPDVVITQVVDLMAEATVEPQVDAGEATTDEAGRFTIRGVWPRSLYLLQAGLGTDNPTAVVVERTPGAGQVVDLGDIVLKNGAVVTGTLVDDAGQPLAGAEVRVVDLPLQILQMAGLERFDPEGAVIISEGDEARVVQLPAWIKRRFDELPLPFARSAADGGFRVTGVTPGSNALVVTAADHLPHLQPGLQLDAGEEKDVGTVRVSEGEEAYGKVTDTNGRAIAGAEVLVGQGGALGEVYFAKKSVISSSDGSFSLLGFKSGRAVPAARRDPGNAWVIGQAQPLSTDLVVVLPATHTLTVHVTSSSGQPLDTPEFKLLPFDDGAVVMAMMGMSNAISLDARMSRLEDGRFRFEGLNSGDYTLLVRCPGHAIKATKVVLQSNLDQTVRLEPEAALAVRVVDRAGKPVRSAAVYAEIRGRDREDRVSEMPIALGRTNSAGRLVASGGVAPGEVQISARHPKYGWAHAEAEVPGQEIVLTFDEPGQIEGTLTEKGNVPTPAKWTIVATRRRGGVGRAMEEMPRLTVPDLDGKFTIEGLQPGEYRLEAIETLSQFNSPGSFMQNMMMARWAAGREERETLVNAGRTSHVALDTEKQPEAVDGPSARVGGTVTVNGLPGSGKMVTGWGERRLGAAVDASGRFDLGDVGEGEIHLRVIDTEQVGMMGGGSLWSKSYSVVANQDLEIVIELATGSLRGVVIGTDGAPAPGTRINLSGILGAPTASGDVNQQPASADMNTLCDQDGRFAFENVPLGTYTVRAQHRENHGIGVTSVQVTGGSQEVQLRLQGTVSASGRVDLASLGQIEHIWLTLQRQAEASVSEWAQVDKDGSFTVDGLLPGTYRASMWISFKGQQRNGNYHHPDVFEIGPRGIEGLLLRPQPVATEKGQ